MSKAAIQGVEDKVRTRTWNVNSNEKQRNGFKRCDEGEKNPFHVCKRHTGSDVLTSYRGDQGYRISFSGSQRKRDGVSLTLGEK